MNRILNYVYSTRLGSLYLEFLLWLDRRKDRKSVKYMSPNQTAQVVRKVEKISMGVRQIKKKVTAAGLGNSLYKDADLIKYAQYEDETDQAALAQTLRELHVKKDKDISTATERARMIDDRIQDMYQLQDHKVKRNMLRNIRQLRQAGDIDQALKLEEEFQTKYGRQRTRP